MAIKVTHIYKTANPNSYGGVEEFIHQLILATKDRINHHVISCGEKYSNNQELGYLTTTWPTSFEVSSCPFSFPLLFNFKNAVEDTDIIHYHFPWPFGDLCHVLNNTKKPSIVTYHSDIIKQRILKWPYKPLRHLFYKKIDKIIATSDNYANSSPLLKSLRDKVQVIPLGICPIPSDNIEERAKLSSQNQEPYIIFVGVLRYYKGLHVLIEAMQGLPFKLLIIGDGPEKQNLLKLAKSYTNIEFLGKVDNATKHQLIQHSEFLVLPSIYRSEAFGVSILEAMQHQKPVISTEIGTGTSFVNQHEETGLVVPPNDVKALKNAIMRLMSDDTLLQKLGINAFQRYRNHFTAEIVAEQYLKTYYSLI